MEVARFTASCRKLSSLLDSSTKTVLGKGTQIGLAQCEGIQTESARSKDAGKNLPDYAAATQGATDRTRADLLMQEHQNCIKSHAMFVQAAVTHLKSLAPVISGLSSQRELYQCNLLTSLFSPLDVYGAVPASWPTSYMHNNLHIYTQFNTLVTCLLGMQSR